MFQLINYNAQPAFEFFFKRYKHNFVPNFQNNVNI